MSRTRHARRSKAERRNVSRNEDGKPSLAEWKHLKTIAAESKTATEYAQRAEAWNSTLAHQVSDRGLADSYLPTYQHCTDLNHRTALLHLEQLIRVAREVRLANQHKLWIRLIKTSQE